MAVTQIELDAELLAEVQRISGATTTQEAVDFAIRELVIRNHEGDAPRHAQKLARTWDYDGWQVLNKRDRANVVHH
ncbi:Arc/MetJ family transcription regulator [Nocardioides albertanoniae]|uniref:Arc/MetJ family transcription regulator n=1 Tax=Nocardioides albertanoniae TaxID=1175486 RepID=A0A543A932_9ACTN|nr:type II toxin-antitoxin system VapB family antitoxin [Nocardioides albertanoniae]TQL69113.1 Arc/MetJ family transcription regulator [Nocardioides albertanoniae]